MKDVNWGGGKKEREFEKNPGAERGVSAFGGTFTMLQGDIRQKASRLRVERGSSGKRKLGCRVRTPVEKQSSSRELPERQRREINKMAVLWRRMKRETRETGAYTEEMKGGVVGGTAMRTDSVRGPVTCWPVQGDRANGESMGWRGLAGGREILRKDPVGEGNQW